MIDFLQGNLLHIQTTANQVNCREIWENKEKKKFLNTAFLQPDETHFATLDANANAQIFLLKQKEEVWVFKKLNRQCNVWLAVGF